MSIHVFQGSPNSLEMESLLDGTTRDVVSQPLAAQRRLSIQDDYTRKRLTQIIAYFVILEGHIFEKSGINGSPEHHANMFVC